jgi:hypothetical protein
MPSKYSYSKKRYNPRRRTPYKGGRKNPRSKRAKVSKYSKTSKMRQINRSNPIQENKQVEGPELAGTVGLGQNGNPILTDWASPPRFLNTEQDFDGELPIANYQNGAKGFAVADSVFNFNPDSCLYQTHGLDESQMVGRSTYQRLCSAKFLIRWPQPSMPIGHLNEASTDTMPDPTDPATTPEVVQEWINNPVNQIMGKIPEIPQSYKLYWGFVNIKMGLSGYTNPTATQASATDIERHINLRVEDWFNERQDRIKYIPKTSNTLKIIGSKTLRPPWQDQTGRQPVSYVDDSHTITQDILHEGSIPDTLVKINWPINRKIHFQPTNLFGGTNQNDGTAGYGPATPTVFYKNFDWMPFAVIVNWNANSLPKDADVSGTEEPHGDNKFQRTQRSPQVLVNDITYYRDS